MRSVIVSVLVCSSAVGYAMDDDQDFSTSPVYIKIMRGKTVREVGQEEQKLLATLKQDFSFDDSKYSSLTNSFASSTDSLAQKESPKGVSQLFVSGESHFSTRSTVEFIGGNYRASSSDRLLLTDLERVLSMHDQNKNESVQLSASTETLSVFSQLRESGISLYSSAEWLEGDCMSLLELLPDIAYRLNPAQSLDVYQSISLEKLLIDEEA